jgi:hypothetical protein
MVWSIPIYTSYTSILPGLPLNPLVYLLFIDSIILLTPRDLAESTDSPGSAYLRDSVVHKTNTYSHLCRTEKKWAGPMQYEDPTGDLMMLPTDMCLMSDPSFRKYVDLYAKDEKKFEEVRFPLYSLFPPFFISSTHIFSCFLRSHAICFPVVLMLVDSHALTLHALLCAGLLRRLQQADGSGLPPGVLVCALDRHWE